MRLNNIKVIIPIVVGLGLLGFLATKFVPPKDRSVHQEAPHEGEKNHEDKHGEKHADHDEHNEQKEHEEGEHDDEHAHKDDEHAHKEDKKDEHGPDSEEGEHKDDHAAKEDGHGDEKGHKDEHGHDEGGSDFGEGKAIVAVKNDGKQFQLSEESSKFLGVTTEPLRIVSPNVVSIKRDLLVEYMSEIGIFTKNGVWIELKKAEIVAETPEYLTIKVSTLKQGDQLITAPIRTLRAAHLQASGEGGKGHAH